MIVYHCDFLDSDKLIFKKEFLGQSQLICVQETSKNKETKKFISIPRTTENNEIFDALEKNDMLMFGLMNDPNSHKPLNPLNPLNPLIKERNNNIDFELYGFI